MNLHPGSRPVPNSPDYVLVERLGAGAFGEVWHAHGPGGVDVALKFIRLDTGYRDIELRSLDVMKSIRHPNLVSLFGAWQTRTHLILAMELCDGTLLDRLGARQTTTRPGIPIDELLGYMHDAATGLDYLNSQQIQHRDVKPANLLLLGDGVKVADFGLAKLLEATVGSNSSGGTIAYMAPECFRGALTPQSDQYSLAVTYYHLRTGQLLFTGDQAKVMYQHLEAEPDLNFVPPEERQILARALAKEPAKRWEDCRDFVEELRLANFMAKRGERDGANFTPPEETVHGFSVGQDRRRAPSSREQNRGAHRPSDGARCEPVAKERRPHHSGAQARGIAALLNWNIQWGRLGRVLAGVGFRVLTRAKALYAKWKTLGKVLIGGYATISISDWLGLEFGDFAFALSFIVCFGAMLWWASRD